MLLVIEGLNPSGGMSSIPVINFRRLDMFPSSMEKSKNNRNDSIDICCNNNSTRFLTLFKDNTFL